MVRDEGSYEALQANELARLKALAITRCQLCDKHGYRGTTVCDHQDHTAAAARGMAEIRTIMGWTPQNDSNPPAGTNTPEQPQSRPEAH